MKNNKQKLLIIGIFLLVLNGCSDKFLLDEIQLEDESANSEIQNLKIPNGFDFSTKQEINITINDNTSYVRYEVYAFSEENYHVGTETFENQEGEIVTEDVYKNELFDKLVFTGIPINGVLKQTISIPSYYDKLYIRRNENLNF